ncbi:MAG TPA: MmpS family transport accessory protein [Mycolicibacillus parakoreensis]|nr:MmpS family transport accessory protein [Mycolicibacillus parakoreensis]
MDILQRRRQRLRPSRLWVPATVFAALGVAMLVALRTPHVAVVDPTNLQVKAATPTFSLGRPAVTYTADGAGAARVHYLGATGELVTAEVHLPWTQTLILSSPMRPASVSVATTDGSAVSCTLSVDGGSRDRQDSSAGSGVVLCSVVST